MLFMAVALLGLSVLLACGTLWHVSRRYRAVHQKVSDLETVGLIPQHDDVVALGKRADNLVTAFASPSPHFPATQLVTITDSVSVGIAISAITLNGTNVALVTGTAKDHAFFDQFIAHLQGKDGYAVGENHFNAEDKSFALTMRFK